MAFEEYVRLQVAHERSFCNDDNNNDDDELTSTMTHAKKAEEVLGHMNAGRRRSEDSSRNGARATTHEVAIQIEA